MLDKIKIKILHFEKQYLLEELIKIFLRPDQYEMVSEDYMPKEDERLLVINEAESSDKNQINREIYDKLSTVTGKKPEWGILTGIRPVKLAGELYERMGSTDSVCKILTEAYYLSEEKARLVADMYLHQQKTCKTAAEKSAGVYIGIPFCPTRCVYCSFASNQVADSEIARYFEALLKEISYVGKRMQECGITAETIYIGGGTPTTLSAEQLRILLKTVKQNLDLTGLRELTVEAGRPDTITAEKLAALREAGVERISINPQSMHEKTLERIGRNHKPQDIIGAFEMAEKYEFSSINADLIAGLPGESTEDFVKSLKEIIALAPENITVHCLAVKRASRLVDIDKDFHYKQAERVAEQLNASREMLKEAGYIPYYLYRQKHMAGAFENTGYCKKDKDCIYNVRIMDEHQTIIALGAGGITKVYYPEENRLERVPNVTNYQEYIARIDEMLDRKEKNLFMEVEKWQS
ncbi:MAG: coproporphyrinogen dehydrogenase HemZ [Emergencia sp.]|nr:coproporphyrinogen dehydrogenase HemZ [Emergencia sp.]